MRMVRVWRIVPTTLYGDNPFVISFPEERKAWCGAYAAVYPSRWNLEGNPVAYAAESQALAAWEVFVHTSTPEMIAPGKHRVVTASFDADKLGSDLLKMIEPREVASLDAAWATNYNFSGVTPLESQKLAHRLLIEENRLALQVPSVVIPGDFNFVLNVKHSEFEKLTFSLPQPFIFDKRVLTLVNSAAGIRS